MRCFIVLLALHVSACRTADGNSSLPVHSYDNDDGFSADGDHETDVSDNNDPRDGDEGDGDGLLADNDEATDEDGRVVPPGPSEDLQVRLDWNSSTDMDLHLTLASSPGDSYDRICGAWDCHWRRPRPVWFSLDQEGLGPNPRLDGDSSLTGEEAEITSIDSPAPGLYRIYVHHYSSDSVDTFSTVRIFLGGELSAKYSRHLTPGKSMWAVAEISWGEDGTGTVMPFPSDTDGEIGAVAILAECSDPGWLWQWP